MSDVKNGNRSRVLIVEDEFLIALDLEAAMTGLGFEICGLAPNAEEARSLAMNHQPDVVLVDVYLGGAREGIETARWLRDVCDASVVFVTAHTDARPWSASKRWCQDRRSWQSPSIASIWRRPSPR